VLVLLASGGGSSRHQAPAGASAGTRAEVHIVVSQTGSLPAAVQDAAGAPAGGGAVLLLGGLDSEEASVPDVLRVAEGAGVKVASLPTPLHDACAAALADGVYLFGGGEQTSFSGILKVPPAALQPGASGSGAEAEQVGSLPTPASDVACAVIGGTVYVIGGYTGQEPLRSIIAWRPGSSPRLVASLPKPLRYASVGVVGGRILIAGGTSGVHSSREVYAFEPAAARVHTIALLPHGVTHAAGVALGGVLLVIGGRGEQPGSQRATILAVSPTGSVGVAGALPRALSDVTAVATPAGAVLAGGADASGHPRSEILALSLSR